MKKSAGWILSGMLLSASAMADTGSLLTNGSFDSSLERWVLTGAYNWTTSGKYSSSASDYFVKLINKKDAASMTQTFATVAGMTYTVSFDYDSKGGDSYFGVNNGSASDALNLSSFITWEKLANGATNMTHMTYTFTALSDVTTLGFSAASKGAKVILNNVSVAAVPEPASIALFMAGLGALGLVSRRRRVK